MEDLSTRISQPAFESYGGKPPHINLVDIAHSPDGFTDILVKFILSRPNSFIPYPVEGGHLLIPIEGGQDVFVPDLKQYAGLPAKTQYNIKVLVCLIYPGLDITNNLQVLNLYNAPLAFTHTERVKRGYSPFHHFGLSIKNFETWQLVLSSLPEYLRPIADDLPTDPYSIHRGQRQLFLGMELQELTVNALLEMIIRKHRLTVQHDIYKVLDVGFGSGALGYRLNGVSSYSNFCYERSQMAIPGIRYFGLSIANMQVAISNLTSDIFAKSSTLEEGQMMFSQGDMNDPAQLSMGSEGYDLVIQSETDEYILPDNLVNFYKTLYRQMNAGGIVVCISWEMNDDPDYQDLRMQKLIDTHYGTTMHSPSKFRYAAEKAGFKIHELDLTSFALSYWEIREKIAEMNENSTTGMGMNKVEKAFLYLYNKSLETGGLHGGSYRLMIFEKEAR